jgi:hypothetical protein
MTHTKKSLAERILDCFPSGAYALHALLQLLEISESRSVETAAVECRIQPKLLVNPDFVATWAETPEKLLMLIMHELHHVLLGHTRLFSCVTKVDNLVFDAVINALLCRMFPGKAYTSFFTDFYDQNDFPACLLRPPSGWTLNSYPVSPSALRGRKMKGLAEVHRSLYSEKGATYHDIFDALRYSLTEEIASGVILLGDHLDGGSQLGRLDAGSPLLFDMVRQIVERWPQPPDPIRGRSLAEILKQEQIEISRKPSNAQILRNLLQRVANAVQGGRGAPLGGKDTTTISTPLPTFDRRSVVLSALGAPSLLHTAELHHRRRIHGERVHVYLDVSGSIDNLKAVLYRTLLDCRDFVYPQVHLFSTEVADVSAGQMRTGTCLSTGGTDIACVAEHMREHRIRRAVLVTDGYVGHPENLHHATLAHATLGVALTPGNSTRGDLADVTNHWVQLNQGGSNEQKLRF